MSANAAGGPSRRPALSSASSPMPARRRSPLVTLALALPLALLLALTSLPPAHAAVPPPAPLLPPPHLPVNASAHTACCGGAAPGLTHDRCDTGRVCAEARHCLLEFTTQLCPYGDNICHCVPVVMISCTHPTQCPDGETCAKLPDAEAYCYSKDVVSVVNAYVEYFGACCGETTTHPPTHSSTYSTTTTGTYSTTATSTIPHSHTHHSTTYTTTASTTTSATDTTTTSKMPTTSHPVTSTTTETYGSSATAIPPGGESPAPTPTPTNTPSYEVPSPTPSATPPRSENTASPTPTNRPSLKPIPKTPSPTPNRPSPSVYSSPSPTPTPGGLAGDPCENANGCKSYRECLHRDTKSKCDLGCTQGVCMNSIVCRCNDDCTDGEVCAGAQGRSYCFSPAVVARSPWVTEYKCNGLGHTGDRCDDEDGCHGDRHCVLGGANCTAGDVLCGEGPRTRCNDGSNPEGYGCYCDSNKSCMCTRDCEKSEVCCGTTYGRICVSKKVVDEQPSLTPIQCEGELVPGFGGSFAMAEPEPPGTRDEEPSVGDGSAASPSPIPPSGGTGTGGTGNSGATNVGSGVCIDAALLQHLPSHSLVYAQHVRAAVLCDAGGSCATPGHMVQFAGRPMMMSAYCTQFVTAGCERRVMWVNSPKLRWGLRVPSRTEGLKFTALAARFATRGEEVALRALVHMGV